MHKAYKSFIALIALYFCCLSVAFAALTPAQIATLRTAVLAEPTLATARNTGDDQTIANWLNALATPYTVWKTNVSVKEIGDKINGTELAGLTSLNVTRLSVVVQLSVEGVNPSLADRRAFFDDIFSGAGGTTTRAQLLALWKRIATKAESLLAVGTGSDAAPATLTFEGRVTTAEAGLMR